MTYADGGDLSGLYFNRGMTNTSPGAIELAHEIVQQVWDQYIFGLPFSPSPTDWSVEPNPGWTLGGLERPTLRELAPYWESPNIAGAMGAVYLSCD